MVEFSTKRLWQLAERIHDMEISNQDRFENVAQTSNNFNIAPSGLMSLKSASVYLGVNLVAVRNLRRFKRMPFCKVAGRVMVRQKDVDNYIESQMIPAGNNITK